MCLVKPGGARCPPGPPIKYVYEDHEGTELAEKTVSLSDMSEVDDKIEQLMEKRDGRHHCKACDYSSTHLWHLKERTCGETH